MQYRKFSTSSNSISREYDGNDLTTYSHKSKKSTLNESFFTLNSEKKEKEKEVSTYDSIKSNLDRNNFINDTKQITGGGIVQIKTGLSETVEQRAKSLDLKRLTAKNNSIPSIMQISTIKDAIKKRPPLPIKTIIQPGDYTGSKRLSLKEKLFNYVESRILSEKSNNVLSEQNFTASDYYPTLESEEKENRFYFSFNGNDADLLSNPATPLFTNPDEDDKKKKRSTSKVLDTIHKLSDSLRTLSSKDSLNQSNGKDSCSSKFDVPKVNIDILK